MWFRARDIPKAGSNPPFTVVNRRALADASGSFTPMGEVAFGNALAKSDLLSRLSAYDTQTLIAVLAQVTANGRIAATVSQVARSLGDPSPVTYVRLMALSQRKWRGRNVLYRIDAAGGLLGFVPSPEIAGQRLGPLELPASGDWSSPTAGRDAIILASRQKYARPRDDVEADIESENGWMMREEKDAAARLFAEMSKPLTPGERQARERLTKHGVDYRVADALVRKHGRDKVARQLAHLPFRKGVKSAAKVLVSSIEGDWDAPAGFPREVG